MLLLEQLAILPCASSCRPCTADIWPARSSQLAGAGCGADHQSAKVYIAQIEETCRKYCARKSLLLSAGSRSRVLVDLRDRIDATHAQDFRSWPRCSQGATMSCESFFFNGAESVYADLPIISRLPAS